MISHLNVLNFSGHKVYHVKNFYAQPINKKEIYDCIIENYFVFFNERLENCDHNFRLDHINYNNYKEYLYYKFFYVCCHIFKDIKLSKNNSTEVWIYANNKKSFSTCIHNHERSSIINGVYYFNVPKKCESKLIFYNEQLKEIGQIEPETDDLLIFDCDLFHEPKQSNTDEFRIALNMEIMCDREILKKFN